MARARTPSSGELADAPEQLLAAAYVRMSTEHQQYSTQNQAQTIREYAERRGIRIVKTYSDDAKSGLIIGGRMALQQMIADVESGEAESSVILVYDATRWGRFQDTDESAFYEYRCLKTEMQVAYCAEQFENDRSPNSTIIKSVKRAKRISRLATIQEHKIILRAIERGEPEARIAAALNVDVALIRRKRTLLNGICPEVAEFLKDKHCPVNSFRSLRKMKPLRQIQAAELMVAASNYTVAYTEAILATDADDLVEEDPSGSGSQNEQHQYNTDKKS